MLGPRDEVPVRGVQEAREDVEQQRRVGRHGPRAPRPPGPGHARIPLEGLQRGAVPRQHAQPRGHVAGRHGPQQPRHEAPPQHPRQCIVGLQRGHELPHGLKRLAVLVRGLGLEAEEGRRLLGLPLGQLLLRGNAQLLAQRHVLLADPRPRVLQQRPLARAVRGRLDQGPERALHPQPPAPPAHVWGRSKRGGMPPR